MSKEEYDRYFNSEEYRRRMALIAKGCENAQKNADKKKAFLATKQRWNHRKAVVEQYGV